MTSDLNKEIASITYNHLNLPTAILFSGSPTKKINYLYDAAGGKLKKTVTNDTAVEATDYLSGFQYRSGSLDFFPTAEGYVKAVNAHGTISYSYIFNHKDHLGNVRMNYTGISGSAQITQQDNYYPFGLKHEKYNVDEYVHVEVEGEDGYDIGLVLLEPGERNPYQYKFGGKEFQDELGLNMYDFGARNYDPALGRWMNIDPLAETSRRFSPYTYALNNPVYFIDPDGMEATDFEGFSDNEDEFLVSPNGNIERVEKEGEHTVVILDDKGDRTGITQDIGNDVNLKKFSSGGADFEVLEIGDPEKAKEAFKKISNESDVEHALINYTDSVGDEKSAIANQGEPDKVAGQGLANAMYDKNGNSVTEIIHNHPQSTPPSGYDVTTFEVLNYPLGDNRNATNYPTNNKGEQIKRAVYRPAFQKINRYDSKKAYSMEDY